MRFPPGLSETVALPPRLEKEIAELRAADHAIEIFEDGAGINLVFSAFPLGEGFNVASSDLLIKVQRTYPDAGPDMFWLEERVLLAIRTEWAEGVKREVELARKYGLEEILLLDRRIGELPPVFKPELEYQRFNHEDPGDGFAKAVEATRKRFLAV